MIYVVAYDIGDDRRRESISATLGAHGARVQLSVFECLIEDPRQMQALEASLNKLLDPDEDQIRIYPLPAGSARALEILGRRHSKSARTSGSCEPLRCSQLASSLFAPRCAPRISAGQRACTRS
jgi:CRISPR-associated protein Cas2